MLLSNALHKRNLSLEEFGGAMFFSPLTHLVYAKPGTVMQRLNTAGPQVGYLWSSTLTLYCGGSATSEWIKTYSADLGCVCILKALVFNSSGIHTSSYRHTQAIQLEVLLPSTSF